MRADPRPQRSAQAAAALVLLAVRWQSRKRRLTVDRAVSMSSVYAESLNQLRY